MAASQVPRKALMVAAIDIGTTFSGWAYQSKADFKSDPLKVFYRTLNSKSSEAPTTVLIKPDGKTFEAFGYKAEEKYAELTGKDEHKAWFYFRRFKMKLFEAEAITLDMTIKAENGKELPALTIFSLVISNLKTDLMEECNKTKVGTIRDSDVLWVLTVPAIWNDGAQQFMREAGIKAGIQGNKLMIALEPEAASVYFKQAFLDRHNAGLECVDTFSPGSKYIVLDAGGNIVGINAYEVLDDSSVKELHEPTSSKWGGTKVDQAFEDLLYQIFGHTVMEKFKQDNIDDYLTLFKTFEVKKREISEKNAFPSNFALPFPIIELCKTSFGMDVRDVLSRSRFADSVTLLNGNTLKISANVMKGLYSDSIKNIIEQLKSIIEDKHVKGCQTILMVGGYSEASLLRDEIKRTFPTMNISTTYESSQIVLKGAVLYGRNPQMLPRKSLMVAAIDIGTTVSGWAYQSKADFKSDPLKVFYRNLNSKSSEAPTTVLIKPDGKTFEAFGYKAEERYDELTGKDEHKAWFYFRRFKMKLFEAEAITLGMTIKAENGKELPALTIFSLAINHLKSDLMEQCNKTKVGTIRDSDVLWVLTVPAIWNDGAKRFMREAGIKAGIQSDKLMIALEPQAASVYFKQAFLDKRNAGLESVDTSSSGSKYIVFDAGRTTVGINAYEVLDDSNVRELHEPTSSKWGGNKVDQAFEDLLYQIFEHTVMEQFKQDNKNDYLTLFRTFEVKKREISETNASPSIFALPCSLIELCKTSFGMDVRDVLSRSRFADSVTLLNGNTLKISANVMKGLYNDSIKNIIEQLKSILEDKHVKDCQTILMVGGYSEASLLRDEIKRTFPTMNISTTYESSQIVLKGAVLYGRNPQMIASRVSWKALLVAAIDFGTTFSGWAYQFKSDYERDPLKIFAKNWNNGTSISCKTPTTVLIRPDGKTLEAFGYKAEDKYAELAGNDEHEAWFYFRRFKMKLFEAKNITLDMTIKAENGKELLALMIFSLVINYLKSDLMEEANKTIVGSLDDSDVLWVLTVPAIWNDSAKQFMREAGIEAGILSDKLVIALEPEVASVYCKQSCLEGITKDTFSPGTKYIVLDAGGGTIDVNVHEVLEDNNMRELYKPTGSKWGGIKVDHAFEDLFCEIFGRLFMNKFKKESMDDYLELFRMFEVKKREVSSKTASPSIFALPLSFLELCKMEVRDVLLRSRFADTVTLPKGNKLKISAPVMQALYNESIENIIEQLEAILEDKHVRGCQTILMVGGYSEASLLQEEIRRTFPKMNIVAPNESSLVVLKGAVLYGRNPQVIASRICRYTYGIGRQTDYNPKIHPVSRMYVNKDGDKKVLRIFCKVVEVGQEVQPHQWYDAGYGNPPTKDASDGICPLFASSDTDPKYTDEPGCFKVGSCLTYFLDKHGKISWANQELMFGGTEIEIRTVLDTTGEETIDTVHLPD